MTTIFFLAYLLSSPSFAAEASSFGQVKHLVGNARVGATALRVGSVLKEGDEIRTGAKSMVRILMAGGVGALQVGPDTSLTLMKRENEAAPVTVDLSKGSILSSLKAAVIPAKTDRYRVRARGVAMGIRGTTFFTRTEPNDRLFQCICEGEVHTKSKQVADSLVSKHHDHQRILLGEKVEAPPAGFDGGHNDEQVAELKTMYTK